jgi:hypothetical protein
LRERTRMLFVNANDAAHFGFKSYCLRHPVFH